MENSVSAMVGAIEIYNKPRFDYRDEVFVILLLNAWELLTKAIISKKRKSIYYPKKRSESYRTLSLTDALKRSFNLCTWPATVPYEPVRRNLDLLSIYRDNAVHFYNERGFGVVIYSLTQTSINNYRDVLREIFGRDLGAEINWQLLPLAAKPPVDPIQYLSTPSKATGSRGRAATEFLALLHESTKELQEAGDDTGRLMTVFDVSLHSVKKIAAADVVVGVSDSPNDALVLFKRTDPNVTHPLRQKDVLAKMSKKRPAFNSRSFHAIVWQYDLRKKEHLCWRDAETGLTKWAPDIVAFIHGLTDDDIKKARDAYTTYQRARR